MTIYTPSDREPLPSGLIPAERIALTVARAQLERGDNPPLNITTVLVATIDRLSAALRTIAELLPACPEPGIANGNDMCICGSGEVWPCGITKAAWLAAGLDPDAEIRKVLDQAKRELAAEMAADEAMRDVCQWHGGRGVSGAPCPICEAEDAPCQAGGADR